jgi:hypothetical protein
MLQVRKFCTGTREEKKYARGGVASSSAAKWRGGIKTAQKIRELLKKKD